MLIRQHLSTNWHTNILTYKCKTIWPVFFFLRWGEGGLLHRKIMSTKCPENLSSTYSKLGSKKEKMALIDSLCHKVKGQTTLVIHLGRYCLLSISRSLHLMSARVPVEKLTHFNIAIFIEMIGWGKSELYFKIIFCFIILCVVFFFLFHFCLVIYWIVIL